MPFGALASLQRRSRQLETLRTMLKTVDAMLELAGKLEADRELTADEQTELAALHVRRTRITQSLTEAGA